MANFTRLTIIKFLELIIVCILIGLDYNSNTTGNLHISMITMGTFGGYLIILVCLSAGSIMGTPVNRRVDLFFSVIGIVLFVTAGALNIDYFNHLYSKTTYRDIGLAKGSLSVIQGFLFLFDAILTFRGEA